MRKYMICILISVCSTSWLFGQKAEHYLSYNFPYTSFFNHTKRNLPLSTPFFTPSLSYKTQKGKYGLELSATIGVVNYELWDVNQYNKGYLDSRINTPSLIVYQLSGLTLHYSILNKKWIKVSPNAGLAFGWYNSDKIAFWGKNYSSELKDWWYEIITDAEVETKWGGTIGINAILPVYKSIYVNSDIKYFAFPFAKYSRRNLLFQMGIGYVFNRNKQ